MKKTEQFLISVYRSIDKRRDSYVELALALASSSYVESVVALSKSPLYRRKFASIYDTLTQVAWDDGKLLAANLSLFQDSCETLSGYEVYSGDSTFIKRSEAKTLAARIMKRLSSGELVYGHETYWTTRLSQPENSWTGIALVERMNPADTVTTAAARQLKRLDKKSVQPKLFVFDAGHGLDLLETQQDCQASDIILRVKSHQVFYYPPFYKGRGRPPKRGERFKLSKVEKKADTQKLVQFKNRRLRISSWYDLHASKFMNLPLTILKLEFLDDNGTPLFAKPIWLVTTATKLDPETIARAYLWRSSHELSFRFMKQHLALTKNNSPTLRQCDTWYQLVALAMNVLLALRDQLTPEPKPWYPQKLDQSVSQRQAQTQALSFFLKFPQLTKPPQPAGKAWGRPLGYQPKPRIRHPVLRKTPKRHKPCPTCPLLQPA